MKNDQRSLLNEILYFFKNPTYQDTLKDIPYYQKLKNVLWIVLWLTLTHLPFIVIITIMIMFFQQKTLNINDAFSGYGSLGFVMLFGVFASALLEESIFRLWFRYKPIYIGISFAVISSLFIFVPIFKHLFTDYPLELFLTFGLPFLLGIAVFLVTRAYRSSFQNLMKKYFKILFYSSTLLFTFFHIMNDIDYLYLIIILISPQFVLGLALGFIRLQYGFLYSVLANIIFNGILYSAWWLVSR